jgi:hypothetical protein
MSKAAVFTMKIEPALREAFMAEAEASHRPASQVVRELMRDYVAQQRDRRERIEFLQRKVDIARASIRDGHDLSNETVEAEFDARRAGLADRM